MLLKQSEAGDNNEIGEDIPQDTLIELDENTVKEKNDNIFFSISDLIQSSVDKEETYYYAQEIYTIQTYEKATYYTYGVLEESGKNNLQDYYQKVQVDFNNNTFLIETLSIEEFRKAKNGEINQIDENAIQKTDNNEYTLKSFSTEEIARRYVKDYMLKVKYMPDTAFTLLNEEYKTRKFGNDVQEFKKYIQSNADRFANFTMNKYQVEVQENSLEYIVLDYYDNYYKIIVYDTLNYKIILDDYTIEDDEYVQQYIEADETDKIATCISKVIKLINAKEYTQVYQYLDDTFKQNNFNTVDKFQQYIENRLFNYNIETIETAEKIGEVYSCKVKIKSGVGVSALETQMMFVIKLLEGTDFVMSFNVE